MMHELTPSQVTPQIRALFDLTDPASIRLTAVLDAVTVGQVWVDDLTNPMWAILRESLYGTLYLGGSPSRAAVQSLIERYQPEGDVLIGLWPDDPRWSMIPTNYQYDGKVIDCTERIPQPANLQIPLVCEIRRVDLALFQRSVDYESNIATFGSAERALEHLIGIYLMRGDEILCEAFASNPIGSIREMGVTTPEAHRRQGYATVTCEHLAHTCESLGFSTYWNCNAENIGSVRLARKLGYQTMQEYRLVAWLPPQ